MAEQSVVAVFHELSKAEDAVRHLVETGYPTDKVSILAQDLQSERHVHGFVTTGDVAKAGAGTGAWVGGLFGLLIGAAFIWVPGIGPLVIAGPLSAAILGGIEGAVGGAALGGLLGGLAGMGISKQHILKYEEVIKSGKYVLVAHGDAASVTKAEDLLKQTSPDELTRHNEAA